MNFATDLFFVMLINQSVHTPARIHDVLSFTEVNLTQSIPHSIFHSLYRLSNLLTKTKSKYNSDEDKEEKERQDMMRGHVKNIGQSVETMENRMRNGLSEIYFSKTKDIVNACRSVNTLVDEHHKKEISSEIHKRLLDKSKTEINVPLH
jgi:uncharacterized alpha-E superfamily protein